MKPITVRSLINTLKTLNQNALVGLSLDAEGNSFALMCDEGSVSDKLYMKCELGYQDTVYEEEEMKAKGTTIKHPFGNGSVKKSDLVECIILWPCD